MEVIHGVVGLEPIYHRFVAELVNLLIIFRVTWILYFDFCLKLMLGYDLDRSLHETKTSWSVLSLPVISDVVEQFFGQKNVEVNKTIAETERDRKLAKFSKLKNEEEMDAELKILKAKIDDLKSDVMCLENMRYSLELSSEPSSRHSKSRQSRESAAEINPPVKNVYSSNNVAASRFISTDTVVAGYSSLRGPEIKFRSAEIKIEPNSAQNSPTHEF